MGDEPTITTSLSADQQGRDDVNPREISRTAQNVNIVRQLLPWAIRFLSMTEGGRRHMEAKPNVEEQADRQIRCYVDMPVMTQGLSKTQQCVVNQTDSSFNVKTLGLLNVTVVVVVIAW